MPEPNEQFDWQVVPEWFHYFRNAVIACGETRVLRYDEALGRHVRFAECVTSEQLVHLTRVYEEVLQRGDLENLWDWLAEATIGSESEKMAAWRIAGVLIVLADLAEKGIDPFYRKLVSPSRPQPPMHGIGILGRLPAELSYLIEPTLKYGRYHSELAIIAFLNAATEDEMEELAALSERVRINGHYRDVLQFLNHFPSTQHDDKAWDLQSLFGVLDLAGFAFEKTEEA
jgi:hypothetical protein